MKLFDLYKATNNNPVLSITACFYTAICSLTVFEV
jgi:hypothetical protein